MGSTLQDDPTLLFNVDHADRSGNHAAQTLTTCVERTSCVTLSKIGVWCPSMLTSRKSSSQNVRFQRPDLLRIHRKHVVDLLHQKLTHVWSAVTAAAMAFSPICGGLNDPPCMEPSTEGPTWQCDEGLITVIPGAASITLVASS